MLSWHPFPDLPEDASRRIMRTHLDGCFLVCQTGECIAADGGATLVGSNPLPPKG